MCGAQLALQRLQQPSRASLDYQFSSMDVIDALGCPLRKVKSTGDVLTLMAGQSARGSQQLDQISFLKRFSCC